ncbi:MAG: hypothetical protein PQJ59_08265 [Spirochaetales bacterium]|nr:hypothetical protein [Spirochaetales bacterium]
MKKTIVLVALVLAMIAAPVFAGEISMAGQVEFGGSYDFDTDTYRADVDDVKIGFTGKADDYTTIKLTMEMQTAFAQGINVSTSDDLDSDSKGDGTVSVQDSEFAVTTDLTGALELDLPVSIKLFSGYNDDIGAKSYDTGGLVRAEEVQDRDPEQNWVLGTYIGYEDITIQAGLYPNYYSADGEDDAELDFTSNMFVGAYGTVADAKFELYYCACDADGMNSVGGSVGYPIDLEGMGVYPMVSFVVDMEDASGDMEDGFTSIGFGTGFTVDDMLKATVGFGYYKDGADYDYNSALQVGFDIQYYLSDVITLFGAVCIDDVIDNHDDYELEWDYYEGYFDGTDGDWDDYETYANAGYQVGAIVKLGKANYYFGYEGGNIDTELTGVDFNQGAFAALNVKF